MKLFIYTIISLWISFPCATFAQDKEMPDSNSDVDRKTILSAAIYTSAWYAGSLYILGQTWYKDKPKAPFHFFNDNKAYLQVDKFGHMFGSYAYSYIGYRGLLKMGATRKEALIYGSTLGFILQLPIEIMDGIHEGYGFSWGDVAANALGSGLVDIPETIRYRQYLLSLDIDWTRIHTNSRFLNLMFKGLTFVKLPFPAVEYNSRGEWKGYWLYFNRNLIFTEMLIYERIHEFGRKCITGITLNPCL